MILTSLHGNMPDGRPVPFFTLSNSKGLEAGISAFGATLVSLKTPDRKGHMEEVVLGLDSLQDFLVANTNFGGIVGRYANRIGEGHLPIDGETYQLPLNLEGKVHLHGGVKGFDRFLWQAESVEENAKQGVQLTYLSPDGQENYPGNLSVTVTYFLTERNALEIHYEATTDKPTVVNLTNHAYFNLSGGLKRDILDHELTLFANRYTPTNEKQVPTGELESVQGTPLDFLSPHSIGERIEDSHPQMLLGSGYDHNFVIDREGDGPALAARVKDPLSGRIMEVFTTQPGVQLYTANWLDGSQSGMGGKAFHRRHSFCLETQHFPDSPNQPNFPSTLLRPGEVYRQMAAFRFPTPAS